MRALTRRADQPHERIDGRPRDPPGVQLLGGEGEQGLGALVLHRADRQPALKRHGLLRVPWPERCVRAGRGELVGARLPARTVPVKVCRVGFQLLAK